MLRMKKKEREIYVKRNHVTKTLEVLMDLEVKKFSESIYKVGEKDSDESTWVFKFKASDETFNRVLYNLSEYNVEVLPPQWVIPEECK